MLCWSSLNCLLAMPVTVFMTDTSSYLQEFRRIKGNISSMREHAELLSSVRDDISEYKVRKLHCQNSFLDAIVSIAS